MTGRLPRLLQREEWASHPTLWKGVEGRSFGTKSPEAPLARPYDEIFITGKAGRSSPSGTHR